MQCTLEQLCWGADPLHSRKSVYNLTPPRTYQTELEMQIWSTGVLSQRCQGGRKHEVVLPPLPALILSFPL